MLYVKYHSIWTVSSWEEEDLQKFTNFYPFLDPFDFRKCESPFLKSSFSKDASYHIWLKSVKWFWRLSVLNVFPYIRLCKMKRPLVGSFLGGFYFYVQTLPCPKDAQCQISDYLDSQFMRRRFFKIRQILHLFAPYWAPIDDSPFSFANLHPHSPKMLTTKFGSNQLSGFEEVV